jgi:hypothetical protein
MNLAQQLDSELHETIPERGLTACLIRNHLLPRICFFCLTEGVLSQATVLFAPVLEWSPHCTTTLSSSSAASSSKEASIWIDLLSPPLIHREACQFPKNQVYFP